MEKAILEKNDYQPLWVNYAESLFAADNYERWVEAYEIKIPGNLKKNGRLKMLYARALVEVGRHTEALEILNDKFLLPDIKEGEFSVSHIWLEAHKKMLARQGVNNVKDEDVYAKYPLPYALDFRMH